MSRIRPARTDDAEALAGLTTQLGYSTDAVAQGRRLAPLVDSPDDAVLVAVDGGDAAIGWVHVGRTRILERDEHAVLHGLVVDDAHRSEGIGAELLAAAESWVAGQGIGALLVRSRDTRGRAHRFYLEHGYAEVKRSHVFEKRLA
jgi:GNAT superfamily N-acetyltransferase